MERSRPFPCSSPQSSDALEASSLALPEAPPVNDSPHERSHLRKRRRVSHGHSETNPLPTINQQDDTTIELIDTAEGSSALSRALAKQREDAVRAQQNADHEQGRSSLASYKCPVCMDAPVDATSTICGHLFCHKCIVDTLKFSEEQRIDAPGRGPKGMCPVCRKPLTRSDLPGPKRNLIPLQLKLSTRKRNPESTNVSTA
ncbi:hypothetical protein BDV59DRAFT_182999 [Aspergillus ambiguus]|uniref:uncharacterized protein n=1 Tax=Aspergillus ambiguus TaxID=176160 RepID=UPI003CCDEB94